MSIIPQFTSNKVKLKDATKKCRKVAILLTTFGKNSILQRNSTKKKSLKLISREKSRNCRCDVCHIVAILMLLFFSGNV